MPSYAVIGASRGIGLELVRQLALSPNNVVFATARNKHTATHLNTALGGIPYKNVHVLEADVSDPKTLQSAATEAAKTADGTLDVLIYNAARLRGEHMLRGLLDYSSEEQLHNDFIEAFEVNVLGAIHAVNAFLPLLRGGSAKKIILVSGGSGQPEFVRKVQMGAMATLSITKCALGMVGVKYSVELKDEGFTVVAVNPGWVDTSATAGNQGAAPSAEDQAKFEDYFKKLKIALPTAKAQTPEAAVKHLLKTIENVTIEASGTYVSG